MSHHSTRSGFCVLVVDDNAKVRTLVRELLRAAGCEAIYCAASADEAVALLHDVEVDVVLTDFHMERKTGVDLTRSIRAFPVPAVASLPIVMMTGDVKADTVAAARAAGVDAFVVKPFSVQALMERLVGAVNKSRAPNLKIKKSANPLNLAV